jgi:hypothetical protein
MPALVLWFTMLTASFSFRVLDRVVGLDNVKAGQQ